MSGSNTALDELYSRAESVSTLLVSCQGCTLCCESGMVYVLEDERERLSRLNVPLVTFGPITYIERASGGACPMLDREARRCSIYEDRPFCCRLFPADIFNRRGRLEWGTYDYCPPEQRNGAKLAAHGDSLGLSSALTALRMLEEYFSFDIWRYLAEEDLVSQESELLDRFRTRYVLFGDVARAELSLVR